MTDHTLIKYAHLLDAMLGVLAPLIMSAQKSGHSVGDFGETLTLLGLALKSAGDLGDGESETTAFLKRLTDWASSDPEEFYRLLSGRELVIYEESGEETEDAGYLLN